MAEQTTKLMANRATHMGNAHAARLHPLAVYPHGFCPEKKAGDHLPARRERVSSP